MGKMIQISEEAWMEIQRILHELTEQVADAVKVGVDNEAQIKERAAIHEMQKPEKQKPEICSLNPLLLVQKDPLGR